MRRRSVILAAAVLIAAFATPPLAHEFHGGTLVLDHPWSRATPPGTTVAGGFLEIDNEGAAEDRLIAVHAAISKSVELHVTVMVDGVMQMRPLQDGIAIPPGSTVILEPGGLHIMFIDLLRPLAEGESLPAELEFEKAGRIAVEFAVQAAGSEPAHGHSD